MRFPALLLTLMISAAAVAEPMDLTDRSGRAIRIEAVERTGDLLTVRQASGKIGTVKISTLSDASKQVVDQAFPLRVVVTSLIVKKVGRKFRYFFDIRNQTSEPWDGTVEITLVNATPGLTNGSEKFRPEGAIQPGLGNAVFSDAWTGPARIHGEAAVTSFRYVVRQANGTEFSGSGPISPKFEQLPTSPP